ncbi:M56 family metallopeptidase [Mucilaginibacter lutimaris]|uniref:M56 family metallopeptidase n=1 Tax=Mucilaginibacter lutimaris TaxID=931629 RepID=A0ABW2ZGH6_9SPHI
MPALFVFLFKVNIALLLFCAGYYLVLRHLTFYTLNRVYLMVAIIFATLYPKIDLSDFAQRHETLAKPVQTVVLNWQAPAESLVKPLSHPNYWQWATVVFWAGAIFLAFRLAMQLFSLFQLHRRSRAAKIHEHDVRVIDGEAAPFSFWRSIYVNPANHTPADLEAILLHEQVHVNGWHTLDILLAELSSIFYWFNPGIWLMKKAVRENIEFITDRKILNKGFDSKTYQYSLVNVSFANTTPGIVNHFNISTIKKRIIMMNAKRSSRFTLTRYAFVVPAVVVLLLVFTLSKAEIAKPITHKIAVAIKPVTIAIKEAAQEAITFNDTTKKPKSAFKAVPADTVKRVENYAITFHTDSDSKSDTGRKQTIFINTDRNHSIDSMNVVLNGKKVDNLVFSKVDPGTIASINIMTANDVKKLPGNNDAYTFKNDRHVIFVTTKDSPEGKVLAEKLGSRRQLTNIQITRPGSDHLVFNSLPALKGTVKDVKIIAHGKASTIPANEIKEIVLDSGIVRVSYPAKSVAGVEYKLRSDGAGNVTTFNGKPVTFSATGTYTETIPDKDVVVTGYGKKYKATGTYTETIRDKDVVVTGYGKKYKATGLNVIDYPMATTVRLGSMDRISDKLIVIDGKVASEKELKKLSAFEIDRMSTSNSADTVKKYGDKAKYGVVYIYTKKGKQ